VETSKQIDSVFLMIGAEPNTEWLNGLLNLDEKGFLKTAGPAAFEATPYATNLHGIYAVGDVRSESVKRVASAVGEGSVVISDVHRHLAERASRIESSVCTRAR
jgi:thioredoxin reductase (NADPH)